MSVDIEKQEVRVKTVLAACSEETRRIARMWLYYTLFYWLFPTLAVVFSYVIANQPVRLLDLLIHGEFLIYAITIVAGSTRLIAKDIPNRGPFVSRQGFNLVSQVMIFPAIVAYALLRYIGTTTSNPYSANSGVIVVYSIVLLIAAFRFSYVVFLIDAQRSTPEELPKRVATEIAHAPDKLKAAFQEIQQHEVKSSVIAPGTEAKEAVEPALPEFSEVEDVTDSPLTSADEEEQ